MKKIDTVEWGEFKVGDLFNKVKTQPIKLKVSDARKTPDAEYNLPALTSSSKDQGLSCYIPRENVTILKELITIAYNGDPGKMFYQPNEFAVLQDAYAIEYKAKQLNKYESLYFVATMEKIIKPQFDWNNKAVWDKVKDKTIKLPITPSGKPDYIYMEEYMKEMERVAREKVAIMDAHTKESKKEIDITNWKEFHLYDDDLFFIESGNKMDKSKMTELNPSINFVGRSGVSNGVTMVVDEKDGIKPYEAGCMTLSLGGEYLGSCFVQDKPFYTSQNVNVLIPKWDMPYYCKLFICAVVFKESRSKYKAFVDELNRHVKTDFSFLLPVAENGKPDFEYMENCMKAIEEKASEKLDNL